MIVLLSISINEKIHEYRFLVGKIGGFFVFGANSDGSYILVKLKKRTQHMATMRLIPNETHTISNVTSDSWLKAPTSFSIVGRKSSLCAKYLQNFYSGSSPRAKMVLASLIFDSFLQELVINNILKYISVYFKIYLRIFSIFLCLQNSL